MRASADRSQRSWPAPPGRPRRPDTQRRSSALGSRLRPEAAVTPTGVGCRAGSWCGKLNGLRKGATMAEQPDASAAGTIDVGGDLTVNRMGFGAMRITGQGIWGAPPNREQAQAALRRAV